MSRGPHISEIVSELEALGAKPAHIRRVMRAWMHLGPWTERASDRFPRLLAERIPEIRARLEGLSRVAMVPSMQAETMKLIVELADGQIVESVLLPRDGLCVSTQVGCAVGCLFCMTGRSGLVRQLSSAEILAQVAEARAIRPQTKKIVLMGMGEPSHNMQAVLEAVHFMGTTLNLAHKDLVVSTVGDERLFDALCASEVKPALALSLHTTDNGLRRKLLPRSSPIPVERLLARTLDYADATKYPAQIEWTLISGVNDSAAQIERLAELIAGRYAMVNFIAVNPVEGSSYARPEQSHIEDLITILRKRGTVATLRMSAAQDVQGGCGQLRARVLKGQSQEVRHGAA